MTADVFDLKQAVQQTGEKLSGLQACLILLKGEAFQFARVSYGDELTLHLGNLRSARSAKLKLQYGSYIIGVRASSWQIKKGTRVVTSAEDGVDGKTAGHGKELTSAELEQSTFIEPGSKVISAKPFPVKPTNSIGLQIEFTDGSTVSVFPQELAAEADGLPEIADWEVTMPEGHLSVGPHLVWSYQSRTSSGAPETKQDKKKKRRTVLVNKPDDQP